MSVEEVHWAGRRLLMDRRPAVVPEMSPLRLVHSGPPTCSRYSNRRLVLWRPSRAKKSCEQRSPAGLSPESRLSLTAISDLTSGAAIPTIFSTADKPSNNATMSASAVVSTSAVPSLAESWTRAISQGASSASTETASDITRRPRPTSASALSLAGFAPVEAASRAQETQASTSAGPILASNSAANLAGPTSVHVGHNFVCSEVDEL